MRYGEILSPRGARSAFRRAAHAHAAHCHIFRAGVSRRQFLQDAAGVTAFAATLGASAPRVYAASASPGIGLVSPIPTLLDIAGELVHVQAPPFTGADSDPATVYDFAGVAGLAYISGQVDRTDRKTGETRTLPYAFNDMRFMQGRFQGRDGHVRDATFVFT